MSRGTRQERFWAKVDTSGDCWIWLAQKDRDGYGRFNADGRPSLAHRMSWFISHGEIPNGMHVLHRCDNPACVRPEHLFLGTQLDNMRDRLSKGRFRNGWERIAMGKRKERMAHVRTGWKRPGGLHKGVS